MKRAVALDRKQDAGRLTHASITTHAGAGRRMWNETRRRTLAEVEESPSRGTLLNIVRDTHAHVKPSASVMPCVSLEAAKNFTSPRSFDDNSESVVIAAQSPSSRYLVVSGVPPCDERVSRRVHVSGKKRSGPFRRASGTWVCHTGRTHGLSGCDLRTICSALRISSALVTLLVLRDRNRVSPTYSYCADIVVMLFARDGVQVHAQEHACCDAQRAVRHKSQHSVERSSADRAHALRLLAGQGESSAGESEDSSEARRCWHVVVASESCVRATATAGRRRRRLIPITRVLTRDDARRGVCTLNGSRLPRARRALHDVVATILPTKSRFAERSLSIFRFPADNARGC